MRNSNIVAVVAAAAAGLLYWYSRSYGPKFIQYDVEPEPYVPPPQPESAVEKAVEWIANIFSARGLRNNNPGNIVRTATQWLGMAADQSADPRFVVFASPVYGIRAMARIVRNYQGRGLNTVRKIITTWAPPTENDTTGYINQVARALGVSPDTPLSASHLPGLLAAIIKHENGTQPYSPEMIAEGIRLEQET